MVETIQVGSLNELNSAELYDRLHKLQQRAVDDLDDRARLLHERELHQLELEIRDRALREVQLALEASLDRYADLYDFAPIGYITLNRDGTILESNHAAARLLGREHAGLEGQPFATGLPDGENARLSDYLHELFDSDGAVGPWRLHLTVGPVGEPGEMRNLLMDCRASPGADTDVGPQACRCALLDVTAQTLAHDELIRQQERYRTVLETASDGFWMIDPQGRITEVNDAYVQRSGYSRDELVGMSIGDLEARETPEEVEAHVAKVKRMGHELFETRHRTKSGETWPVEVSVTYSVAAGSLFFAFFRDISERSRLEQEIIAASTMEQERIGREIHDGIGQQLTGLTMMAEALKRDLLDAGRKDKADSAAFLLEHLREAVEHARMLAHGLSPVQIDTQGLADALRTLCKRVQKTTGVSCEYRGASIFDFGGNISALHLYRVAQEGVQNALKHGSPTGIDVDLREENGSVILEVRDDGVGIPEAHARGNGLGLRIMQYRAGIMGGSCRIRRVGDRGTLLRCVVPLEAKA